MVCDVPAHQICMGKYMAWHVACKGCCGCGRVSPNQADEFSVCGLGLGRVCDAVGRDGAGKGRNRSLLRTVRLRMGCSRREEVAAVGFA